MDFGSQISPFKHRCGAARWEPESDHRSITILLAISIIRIRCESVTVNKTLASIAADAFT